MKTYQIKANRKNGTCEPVLTCKTYNSNEYGHTARLLDKNGKEIARIIYRPQNPLSCGAHVWIETKCKVEVDCIANDEIKSKAR